MLWISPAQDTQEFFSLLHVLVEDGDSAETATPEVVMRAARDSARMVAAGMPCSGADRSSQFIF
jgi:hypothetical protein